MKELTKEQKKYVWLLVICGALAAFAIGFWIGQIFYGVGWRFFG